MLATFEVDRWLQQKRPAELHVSQPYQTGCWSKLSARQGGDVQHGDNSGAMTWSLHTLNDVCWRTRLAYSNDTCCSVGASCYYAGLHPFCSPDLPADLGLGYPEQYVKKADDAAVGVEPVAEAVIRVSLMFTQSSSILSAVYAV